jgi:hypothetical protein
MVGEGAVGHDGLRAMMQVYFEAVSSLKLEILEARIDGEGVLLTLERASVVSAVMAVELSRDTWAATEFRDGLVGERRAKYRSGPRGGGPDEAHRYLEEVVRGDFHAAHRSIAA